MTRGAKVAVVGLPLGAGLRRDPEAKHVMPRNPWSAPHDQGVCLLCAEGGLAQLSGLLVGEWVSRKDALKSSWGSLSAGTLPSLVGLIHRVSIGKAWNKIKE